MNLKRILIAIAGLSLAAILIAQTSQSSSSQSSKSGNGQASSSSSSHASSSSSSSKNSGANSSAFKNAFGSSRNGSSSSNRSGNSMSDSDRDSMASVSHAIMFMVDSSKRNSEQVHQQAHQGHMKYMADMQAKGKVVLQGPWRDVPGAMAIVAAESDDEALAIAKNDPAVKAGVLKFEVRAWIVQ